jgi:hypothetical protein
MAEQGHQVLLIDMDAQGHLTQLFRGKPGKGQTKLYYSLIHEQPSSETIVPTSNPNLFLIPATEDHYYLNSALLSKPWREKEGSLPRARFLKRLITSAAAALASVIESRMSLGSIVVPATKTPALVVIIGLIFECFSAINLSSLTEKNMSMFLTGLIRN